MKSISFIHLGDVHYPQSKNPLAGLDLKDTGVSSTLLQRLAPQPLNNVMKEVRRLLEKEEIAGVLLSGDLTTRADMDEYRACIEYLRMSLGEFPLWCEEGLHVVPGNHDVDQTQVSAPSAVDEDPPISFEKFESIRQAWVDVGLPILAVDSLRVHTLNIGTSKALVCSINSCFGCGEYRRYPAPIRDALLKLIADEEKAGVPSSVSLAEQLDSPAFDDGHITEIVENITDAGLFVPAIVLGHHAILPQAIPRVAVYTEMVNGGVARFRLAGCPNPIVYCHGHIHENPVEVVIHPDRESRPLLLVSAPTLSDGFNLLRFYYTDVGMVLGCEVIRYNSQSYGGVQPAAPIRVALSDPSEPEYASDDISRAISPVLTREFVRFGVIEAEVKARVPSAPVDEIADRLKEMEWFGLIEIIARESATKHWHVRRRVA